MKIKLLAILSMTFINVVVMAQNQKKVFACSYYGSKFNERAICNQFYGFKDKSDAEAIVKKIVDLSGLPQNFYLIECPNVDNCFATVRQEEAVIIYDNNFMKKANDMTHNNWAEISILAHEIGHHLSMHTIKSGGSDPKKELEADSFSGFIMYKLGASLTDAQAAIKKLTSEYDAGGTHPPRNQRLTAIEKGYNKAKGINQQTSNINVDNTPIVESKKETQRVKNILIDIPNVDNSVDKPIILTKNVENTPKRIPEQPKITIESEDENPKNTTKRIGCIEGDCEEGYGVAINRNNEETYKGEWHDGKREGKGIEYYKEGQKKYEGDFSMSRWNGNGTYFSKDGNTFVGKFVDNQLECEQCLVYFKNGERYIGKFVNGKRNGRGVIIHRDGRRENVMYVNDIKSNY